jgi:plasmid stabilization system protein ParE
MKKYKIIFSKNAEIDIEQAVIYYDEQQKDLAKRFIEEVQKTLDNIKTNPYYARVRYADIRCAIVNIFPFLIHYNIQEDLRTIRILAVYSTYRKPLW